MWRPLLSELLRTRNTKRSFRDQVCGLPQEFCKKSYCISYSQNGRSWNYRLSVKQEKKFGACSCFHKHPCLQISPINYPLRWKYHRRCHSSLVDFVGLRSHTLNRSERFLHTFSLILWSSRAQFSSQSGYRPYLLIGCGNHSSFGSKEPPPLSYKRNHNSRSHYSSQSGFDDLLRMISKPGDNVYNPRPSFKASKNLQKAAKKIVTDNSLSELSIEKQLRSLMALWEMEKAVCVLKAAVLDGLRPDRTILLDFLQQLANLGEVDCLLELHQFMKEHSLTSNQQFYHILRDAYQNCGRVDEGIAVLRMIYHGSRDFEDADILFTLLATMILKEFDHQRSLVLQFVEDLETGEPPVPARSSLWQCYVLTGKFGEADALVKDYPELKALIPAQVTKFTQSQLQIDYDKDAVFSWLLNLDLLKPGLKAQVFDHLIRLRSEAGEWDQALSHMTWAMDTGQQKIHKHTVTTFLRQFLGQLSASQVEQLKQWAEGLVDGSQDVGDGEKDGR